MLLLNKHTHFFTISKTVPTITIRDDGVDELFGYISSRSKSAKQIVYDVQPTTSFQSTPTNCWFEWVGSDSEHRPGEVQSYVPDCPEIPAVAQKPFQAEEPVPVPHAVHANECDLPIVFESVASPYRCLEFGTREPGDAGCDISLDSILPVALADVHRPAGEQQVKAVIPLSEPYVTQAAVDATFGGQAHATAQPHVADRGTSGNKRDKLTIQTQRATLQKLRQEVCMLKAKLQLTSRQLRNKDTELAAQKALIDQMKKDHLHQLQQQQHQIETDFKEKFRNIYILKM